MKSRPRIQEPVFKPSLSSDGNDLWRSMPDVVLIDYCLSGDTRAYAILVERHQQKVFNVLYRLLGNYGESQDMSQETFITAYRSLSLFRGDCQFSTWLCQIGLNKARDLLRSRAAHGAHENLEDYEGVLAISDKEAPDRHMETEQQNHRIQQVLQKMPANYREVLVLKHLEGYSYEEMAMTLNDTVDNLKVRTFRARQLFQKLYAEQT